MLMNVVLEHTIAPKHVQTLMETLIVDVIVAIYWMLMELLVIVCIRNNYNCTYSNNVNAYNNIYLYSKRLSRDVVTLSTHNIPLMFDVFTVNGLWVHN